MRTRSLPHAGPDKADVVGEGSLAQPRRLGRRSSPQYRSRVGARAEQASVGRALALMALPVFGLLVFALMGLGSAVGVASPPSQPKVSDSVNVDSAQSRGFAVAVVRLSERRTARMLAANPQDPSQPGAQASAHREDKSVIQTTAEVAQAIAPTPSDVINPMAEPAPAVPVAAATSIAATAASARPKSRGTITIETFGYSFGEAPTGSAFVADVRNIDAGTFVQTETGLMPSVRDRVMATSAAQTWLQRFRSEWMPSLHDGDKVAIGCSRGHHRSVTLGLLFADDLRAQGYTVNLVHRDILRTW